MRISYDLQTTDVLPSQIFNINRDNASKFRRMLLNKAFITIFFQRREIDSAWRAVDSVKLPVQHSRLITATCVSNGFHKIIIKFSLLWWCCFFLQIFKIQILKICSQNPFFLIFFLQIILWPSQCLWKVFFKGFMSPRFKLIKTFIFTFKCGVNYHCPT